MSQMWIEIVGVAVIVLVVAMKRQGQISAAKAEEMLRGGALVVDVRSAAEFGGGHLKGAVNIPLDVIETELPKRVKDKGTVILLHCQSGMRSGMAQRKLRGLGYAESWNLGSYGRAAGIVERGK